MSSISYNSGYSTGVNPTGIWRAYVKEVGESTVSVTIPRLGQGNIYRDVPFTGGSPFVGQQVWVGFIEGKSNLPIVIDAIAGSYLSDLPTVELSYDDSVVISDDSDNDEPKLATVADVVNLANAEGGEPIGHAVRTDSVISFDHSTLTFTIAPVAGSYTVWCKGRRFVKTSSESVTIPNADGLYYISFDENGVLQYSTTYFVWDSDTPTAYIYFNAANPSKYMLFDERHGIVLDWQTHEYLHRTRGAVIANGFDISFNGGTTGDDAADAQIDLDGGTFFDEDLQVDIVHSDSPTANTWQQDLQGPARLPVFYATGSGWVYDDPTDYPVKQGSAHPKYNLYSAGVWSTPDVGANKYGVYWVVATNNLNYPVISVMGQGEYSNIAGAEAATWDSMILEDLPIVEFRVLYKIVFRATGGNVPHCYFEQLYDFRVSEVAGSGTVIGDHGGLTGLADDDHPQYARLTTSDTAPSSPRANDLWYKSSESKLYTYYYDGTSFQWVEIGGTIVTSVSTGGAGSSDFANIFMMMGV